MSRSKECFADRVVNADCTANVAIMLYLLNKRSAENADAINCAYLTLGEIVYLMNDY